LAGSFFFKAMESDSTRSKFNSSALLMAQQRRYGFSWQEIAARKKSYSYSISRRNFVNEKWAVRRYEYIRAGSRKPVPVLFSDICFPAMPENKPKRKLIDRLRNKYRLVVMNDDTFEERLSLRQTPLGFLILISAITIVMTTLIVSLIAFTPIREYIPGYANVSAESELLNLQWKTDSLERSMKLKQQYLDNVMTILSGKDTAEHPQNPHDSSKKYTNLKFKPSAADSALRNRVESQDQYALTVNFTKRDGIAGFFFFAPIKGTVSNTFNAAEEHFGVDISASNDNEPVRATLEGTVISAGWTINDGYVIQVQHSNNIISIYKHNAALLKKTGDYVKAGDPIAIVGNSGEQIAGPHLHFELWYNGAALDPQEYMVF
jgi:murein DD-endopeptidase MepM/ murein hydrolase activator NlpD